MTSSDLPIFLKAIHIQGFKSFADKVTLELQHGLSVIVGPNGSGKSNIADAVRWVLGEQSAKSLRGSKMEDVIFSGSSSRRGVGMAEVALVFDNSRGILPIEYKEVTIARRVYRDGEGQYFINRVPCRLKDIHELLMDTGIGKEGFSVIGQGRVDEILNLRSEERRTLIEEAAGITKYRHRKQEALKRLDETEQNLTRLEDILREISGQLEPLALQAEQAQKSKELTEELRRLEIQLVVRDLNEINAKLSDLTAKMGSQKEQLAFKLKKLAQLEQNHAERDVELAHLNEHIQAEQESVYRLEQLQSTKQHDINLRQERIVHLQGQVQRLKQDIQEEAKRQESLRQTLGSLESKRALLRETVDQAQKQIAALEEELQNARSAKNIDRIERLKTDVFQALADKANITNALTSLDRRLLSINLRKQQINAEKEAALNERLDQEQLSREHQEAIKRYAAKEAELQQEVREKLDELEKTGAELKTLEEDRQRLGRRVDGMRARLQALRGMAESLEGYSQGVREIIKAHKQGVKQCQGVCGTVAELLKTPREFELALETALGAGLQNVITVTEADAKSCIAYLKQNRLGRVTFLPLDILRPSRLNVERFRHIKGFIGLAADLAEVNPRYRPAVDFLLGRTLVAVNLDAATEIARAGDYQVRVVTLEGDLISPGGSMTGGSVPQRGGGLLGRARELEELAAELLREEASLETLTAQIADRSGRRQELEFQIKRLNDLLADLREKRTALAVNVENLQANWRRISDRIALLEAEGERLDAEEQQLQKAIGEERARLDAKEEEIAHLSQELKDLESKAEAAARVVEELSERLTKDKVQLAKWEEEYAQTADLIRREQDALREKAVQIEQKQRELSHLEETMATITAEINGFQEELGGVEAEIASRHQALVSLRQQRERLIAQLRHVEDEIKVVRLHIQELEQAIHAGEVRAARLEAEWDNNNQRLNEEFGLTWEAAQVYTSTLSRGELSQRIQETKQRIESLGPVNHAALEEYPKLKKRYDFLTAQRDDLVQAHASLRDLIAELDKVMSERFREGFDAVNAAFRSVFTELFEGGEAELRLSDPDNLLETGIEIIAQPPGKKPQLLSLLSGGERALTAIAILFALLQVRPSPFCILDEIEASLDESNVARFAKYIQKLAKNTQFLIISHRRGTMEAADALYGVTMEESGVSKLLTVKLNGDKEAETA